jgi:transposase-like protein
MTLTPNRRPYPAEFRARAVELAQSSGLELAQVARDLGIDRDTIRRWMRQAEVDAGTQAGIQTDERAELLRLRRENALLKEEREILRKATPFANHRAAA